MATQNNSSNNVSGFPYGVPLTGLKFPSGFGSNLGSGDNDLYTVPAGKKAIISGSMYFNQSGVATVNAFFQMKVSAVYYRISSTFSPTIGAAGTLLIVNYIANAGEILSINTDAAGLNVWVKILEFDATVPVKSAPVWSLSNGSNTIYTVPAGKTALILDTSLNVNSLAAGLFYVNVSGTTRAIVWYAVPSGGSAGATNQIIASTNVSTVSRSNQSACLSMATGDFLVLNTDSGTTTQSAWVNLVEI